MRDYLHMYRSDGEHYGEFPVRELLPPDVVDKAFTVTYLRKILNSSGRAVKLVLTDQAKLGGVGNIYANDALWLAGINPSSPSIIISLFAESR